MPSIPLSRPHRGQFALPAMLAVVLAVTVPAQLAPGPPPPASPAFPHSLLRGGFRFYADVDQPLLELAKVAAATERRLRDWPAFATVRTPSLKIFLCATTETMLDLEERHGYPRSTSTGVRSFAYRGGYYARAGLVLLRAAPDEDMRRQIAHEVTHALLGRIARRPPDVLNEGFAEYVSLSLPQARPASADYRDHLQDEIARALAQDPHPSLARLFRLDYWRFRDRRIGDRSFAFSWALLQVLAESPTLRAGFPRLLEHLASPRRADLETLAAAFGDAPIEALWHEHLAFLAAWEAPFGGWTRTGDAFATSVPPTGSNYALSRRAAPGPWQLAFDLPDPLRDDLGVGIVLGHENERNFAVLSLRDAGRELVLVSRLGDRWAEPVRIAIARPQATRLEVRCDAFENITVFLDEQPILSDRRMPGAARGRYGPFVEFRSTTATAPTDTILRALRCR